MSGLLLVLALQSGIDWKPDFESARKAGEGRLLLVSFVMKGRPVTQALEEETFSNAAVQLRIRERFSAVRREAASSVDFFRGVIGGRGAVASAVMDASGDVVSVLPGFAGPNEFLRFLERAESGYPALLKAREAWRRLPHSLGEIFTLGERYRDLESWKRAEECWLEVVEHAAGLSEAHAGERVWAAASHERLARRRVLRGRIAETKRHLGEARRLDGERRLEPGLLLSEGLVLGLERRHAEAARILDEALQRFPGHAEKDHVLFALGFVLHQDRKDARALEVLEGMLAAHPKSAWAPAAREQVGHIKNPQPDHEH